MKKQYRFYFGKPLLATMLALSLTASALPSVTIPACAAEAEHNVGVQAEKRTLSTSYSLGDLTLTKTIGNYAFSAYSAEITQRQVTQEGTIVVVDVNDSDDLITTADIMESYSEFLSELSSSNVEESDIVGLVINAGEIEISAPIVVPYLEIQADAIYYGELEDDADDDMDDEEDMDEEEIEEDGVEERAYSVYTPESFTVDNTYGIYFNAQLVQLFNQNGVAWNVDYIDIIANAAHFINTPILSNTLNVFGDGASTAIVENSYMNQLYVGFLSCPENYVDDSFYNDFNGGFIEESEYFCIQTGVPVTVYFDVNDGETEPTVYESSYDTELEDMLFTPERTGYTFDGWYTAKEGGKSVRFDDVVDGTGEVTYYAHWTANEYQVTIVKDEENPEDTIEETAVFDSLCSFLPDLEKEGYILRGFTDKDKVQLLKKSDKYTIDGDITLYPVWRESDCPHSSTDIINVIEPSCSEEGYSGDTYCNICEDVIEYGDVLEKTPHKNTELRNYEDSTCKTTGYTGDVVCTDCEEVVESGEVMDKLSHKWDQGVVTKNATLTSEGSITYTCELCGSTRTQVVPVLSEDQKDPEPDTPSTEQPKTEQPKAEQPIVEEVSYTITYVLNGGTNASGNPGTYTSKTQTITLQNPTRKGYVFDGWYSDSRYKSRVYEIRISSTGDRTLYAKWTKVSVKKPAGVKATNQKGKKLKVTYKKVSGAKGYEIQYCTSKKFKKSVKSKTTSKASYTAKKLKKGKTYYVRIRAYKKDSTGAKVYSKWSSVKKVKIIK